MIKGLEIEVYLSQISTELLLPKDYSEMDFEHYLDIHRYDDFCLCEDSPPIYLRPEVIMNVRQKFKFCLSCNTWGHRFGSDVCCQKSKIIEGIDILEGIMIRYNMILQFL